MPGCEAVQRGGVVVCCKACRSINMEGGLGMQWVFWGAAAKERDTTQMVEGRWRRRRHTKPRDSLPEGASLCVAWVLPNF